MRQTGFMWPCERAHYVALVYYIIMPIILVGQMLKYLLCTQILTYLNILSSFEQFYYCMYV